MSLEQYSGVVAALDDGFELAPVLAQEHLAEDAWRSAERAFRQVLAEHPGLMLRHLELRALAEDCLARRITPLDDDPGAWSALLTMWVTTANPTATVAGLGLTLNDINRLGRRWLRRAAADEAVAAKLRELAGSTSPLDALELEPLRLTAFPWSPQPATPATPASHLDALRARDGEGRLPIELDLDLYAALTQLVAEVPHAAAQAMALCGVDHETLAAIEDAWDAQASRDPSVRAELQVKLADHRAAIQALERGARPQLATEDAAPHARAHSS